MDENYNLNDLSNLEEFPYLKKSLSSVKVREGRLVEDDSDRFKLEKISLKNLPLNELSVGTII